MYICICNGITDKHISKAVADGACSMRELRCQLGVSSQCGKCHQAAKIVLHTELSKKNKQALLPPKQPPSNRADYYQK